MSIYIYNFHSVSNEQSPAYPPMPVKTFERVIKYLQRYYVIVPQEELLTTAMPYTKKDKCVITFDDGYKDFMDNALPVIAKHQVPVSLHVVSNTATTGEMFWTQKLNKTLEAYYKQRKSITNVFPQIYHINNLKDIEKIAVEIYMQLLNDNSRDDIIDTMINNLRAPIDSTPMLTWEDIQALPKQWVAIGSHTHSHTNLLTLSAEEVYNELLASYQQIQEHTGTAPISIAYPNGQYNENINNMAREIGYKIMYTCNEAKNRFNTLGLYNRENVYNTSFWKNWVKLLYWQYK